MKKKIRGLLANLLVFGISLFICLLVLEIAARFFLADLQPLMRPDKYVGSLYVSGRTVDLYSDESKKTIEVKSNSLGFRDYEFNLEKPTGIKRIAIFGDSFTDAVQVEESARFSEQLENFLNQNLPEKKYEVMNFGVAGTGTAQQYKVYQYYAAPFKPDLVIVGFYNGNDVENNSIRLTPNSERTNYILGANGKLETAPVTFNQKIVWQVRTFFGSHSALFRIAYKYLPNAKPLHQLLMKFGLVPSQLAANAGPETLPPSFQVIKKDYSGDWQNAWQVTEEIFKEFKETSVSNKAEFMILDIPDAYQCYPDRFANKIKNVGSATTTDFILAKPQQILNEFTGQNNINYLSLLDDFRKNYEETKECLYFDCRGHLTPAGHQLAAEKLFAYLKEKNLVE